MIIKNIDSIKVKVFLIMNLDLFHHHSGRTEDFISGLFFLLLLTA